MGLNVNLAAEEVAKVTGRDPELMKRIVRLAKAENFLSTGTGRGKSAAKATPEDVVRSFVLAALPSYKQKEGVESAEKLLRSACHGVPKTFERHVGVKNGETFEVVLVKLFVWLADEIDEIGENGDFADLSVEMNVTSGVASIWGIDELRFGDFAERDRRRKTQIISTTPLHALRKLSWIVAGS